MSENINDITELRNKLQEEYGNHFDKQLENLARQGLTLFNGNEVEVNTKVDALLRLMMIDYLKNNFKDNSQQT